MLSFSYYHIFEINDAKVIKRNETRKFFVKIVRFLRYNNRISQEMTTFVPMIEQTDSRMKKYIKRHLPYKLYVVREGLETYYADYDLTKVTPRRMLADAYVFTEDDLSALIKQHGDRINLITKDEELKDGFYNVISFDYYGMDVYLDIKTYFEYNNLGEYDTELIEPLITKHLKNKKIYRNLMEAVVNELKANIKE